MLADCLEPCIKGPSPRLHPTREAGSARLSRPVHRDSLAFPLELCSSVKLAPLRS